MQHDFVAHTENIGILFDTMSKGQTYAAKVAPNHGTSPAGSTVAAARGATGGTNERSQGNPGRPAVLAQNQQ